MITARRATLPLELQGHDFADTDQQSQRHLPLPMAEHVQNSLARFGQMPSPSTPVRRQAARLLSAARRFRCHVEDHDPVRLALL